MQDIKIVSTRLEEKKTLLALLEEEQKVDQKLKQLQAVIIVPPNNQLMLSTNNAKVGSPLSLNKNKTNSFGTKELLNQPFKLRVSSAGFDSKYPGKITRSIVLDDSRIAKSFGRKNAFTISLPEISPDVQTNSQLLKLFGSLEASLKRGSSRETSVIGTADFDIRKKNCGKGLTWNVKDVYNFNLNTQDTTIFPMKLDLLLLNKDPVLSSSFKEETQKGRKGEIFIHQSCPTLEWVNADGEKGKPYDFVDSSRARKIETRTCAVEKGGLSIRKRHVDNNTWADLYVLLDLEKDNTIRFVGEITGAQVRAIIANGKSNLVDNEFYLIDRNNLTKVSSL